VLGLAVVAEPFTVVARDEDGGWRPGPAAKRVHEAAELLVHGRHLAEVRAAGVRLAEPLGRLVGMVRVEVMDPEEQRPPRQRPEVRQRRRCRLVGRSLGLLPRQVVVVDVEAALEAEAPCEDEGRDERRGAIAGAPEPLGDHGVRGLENAPVLVQPVAARIQSRHHRDVRRQRFGHRGVGVPEAPAGGGQRIEGGGSDPDRLGADGVRPRRVERDEQDGRHPHGRPGGRRGDRFAPAPSQPGDQHENCEALP
jgi:hypothetical protein